MNDLSCIESETERVPLKGDDAVLALDLGAVELVDGGKKLFNAVDRDTSCIYSDVEVLDFFGCLLAERRVGDTVSESDDQAVDTSGEEELAGLLVGLRRSSKNSRCSIGYGVTVNGIS